MFTPGIEQLAKARYHILLQEIETGQHIRRARADRPGFHDRLLESLGEFLISFGLELKKRYGANSAAPVSGRLAEVGLRI